VTGPTLTNMIQYD